MQGWRETGGGHTFYVVDHDVGTDRVLLLESNLAFGLNGPGYRVFGPLEKFGTRAPPQWRDAREAWTWAQVCRHYPRRLHAALRVKGRTLSGLG